MNGRTSEIASHAAGNPLLAQERSINAGHRASKPELCILKEVTAAPRILYIAYPLLTVSDQSAGGAEQVLWNLEREMFRRGAATTVAASAGSRIAGELFATGQPCTVPDDYERRNREHQEQVLEYMHRRSRQGCGFDLVHDMSGSFWGRAGAVDVPVLATLHLPRSFYAPQSFQNVPANVCFSCVSRAQARTFGDLGGMLAVVPNGIALERFDQDAHAPADGQPWPRNGLLWLGRICEEKAPHLALEIAGRAGLPITLAGQVYPFSYHQEYFEREVAPRLRRGWQAKYVCSPSFEQKRSLLRRAQALLITSLAEETSSLVAMEAAASGTPVIALRRGALTEIVKEGITGFLVEDVDSALAVCRSLGEISAAACMQYAKENFSGAAMADGYSRLYTRIVEAAAQPTLLSLNVL
jgi:glycosyltransferase involved in cell wall biosynthesis